MRKILFLGASSQITKSFINHDFDKKICKKNIKVLSFRKFNTFEKLINKFKPDIIVNTFVYHPVDLCEKNKLKSYQGNVLLIKKIINTIKKSKVINPLLIHFSSDYVYSSFNKNYLCNEYDSLKPVNVLGMHKAMAEKYLVKNYKNHLIFRISWLFSLYNNNFVKTMLHVFKKNKIVKVINNQYGNPTSTSLISKVLLKLFYKYNIKTTNGIFNLCSTPNVSWFDFAKEIKKNIKGKVDNINILPVSSFDYNKLLNVKTKRPYNSSMNIYKVQSHFKIRKKDFDWREDLKEIINSLSHFN